MRIRDNEDGSVVISIDPGERSVVTKADRELSGTDDTKLDLIDSTINAVLVSCRNEEYYSNIVAYMSDSLKILLEPETADFLMSSIVGDPKNIKKMLEGLRQESLITPKTANLIQQLFMKYGMQMNIILLKSQRPNDWQRIVTNLLVEHNIVKLQSQIYTLGGQVLRFDAPLVDGITLAEHFIRKTVESINIINKELVLSLDETKIKDLEERLSELKELIDQVKSELKSTECED